MDTVHSVLQLSALIKQQLVSEGLTNQIAWNKHRPTPWQPHNTLKQLRGFQIVNYPFYSYMDPGPSSFVSSRLLHCMGHAPIIKYACITTFHSPSKSQTFIGDLCCRAFGVWLHLICTLSLAATKPQGHPSGCNHYNYVWNGRHAEKNNHLLSDEWQLKNH